MEQLKVIQVRKRKPKEVAQSHEPDMYDKAVEKAFWFVIGFSVALMVCCVAFGQSVIYMKKSAIARRQPLRHLEN